MKKRILSFILVASLAMTGLAGCNQGSESSQPSESGSTGSSTPASSGSQSSSEASSTPAETVSYENKAILGNSTELSGDFRVPGWGSSTAGAADQDINRLTSYDYNTMAANQGGAYVWNDTVVKEHSEALNEDGTKTYTIKINEGLKFSDGSPITIKNYLASALSFSTPVTQAAGYNGAGDQHVVGYENYKVYTGPGSAEGTKEFSGYRMIDDYTCSITINSEYSNYYFAYTYGNLPCRAMGLVLGEGVDIMDDGNGCYLTDNYYEKNGSDEYVKATELSANRYDITKYPYCGAYVVEKYDEGTKEATLKLNPEFQGNFEGQKPSIETIVYVKIISETQLATLQSGGIDVLSGITGGDETKETLAIVDDEKFSGVHYHRPGFGKIQFECDFGPTMFQEVRQAVAYLLNRNEFCQQFTGGYGVVVDGPYSPDFDMWKAVQDEIELIDYSYSPDTAVKILEDGGWVYNSKGEPWAAGATGVDAVRYKKLTAEEAEGNPNSKDVNKSYKSVANTDGVEYKTVEVNGEYYMPLVINWFGTADNTVTDMLTTNLANSSDVAAAGMIIRPTQGDLTTLRGNIYRDSSMGYEGTPTYGMVNMALGWTSAVYDYAYNWSLEADHFKNSSVKLFDEYDKAFPYDLNDPKKLTYEEAMEASGGKLGMDYLSMAMVYNSKDVDEYNQWWMGYIERWNQLMPEIPLYSNYYYDVYNAKLENFVTSPFFGPARAILYANVKGHAAN